MQSMPVLWLTRRIFVRWEGIRNSEYEYILTILEVLVLLTTPAKRNFRYISIVGFGCTLIATWEVILTYVMSSCSILQDSFN